MMPGIMLSDLAGAIDGATLHGSDAPVSSVGIDSRHCKAGQLFVALRGQHSDGHEYVAGAARAGACAALVEQLQDCTLPQIKVASAERALASIAAFNRDRFRGKVIAVTGSAGKTACKNMLASIFARTARLLVTRGNFNNELGLPLTLTELDASHDLAVLEMGAAKAGDITYLAGIAQPHVGLVTNVSEAHLGGFGSIEATARTKGELFDALPRDGVAVMNREDRFFEQWQQRFCEQHAAHQVWSFALADPRADFYATEISEDASGSRFTVRSDRVRPGWQIPISLPLLGAHNVGNAVACITLCKALALEDEFIRAGLAAVQAESHRLQRCGACNELYLFDDSYNASPASMLAALQAVATLHRARVVNTGAGSDASARDLHCIAVLGDMAELGERAATLHRQAGEQAAEHGYTLLFAIGAHAGQYLAGYEAAGGCGGRVLQSVEQLAACLQDEALRAATVLVKGSRVANMDRLVELLRLPDGAALADRPAGERAPC